MKKINKLLFVALLAALIAGLYCQPVFAITESDVQAQVDASSKEAVAGNVLVWFLCAVAFLKVSQKIDSFMSSLGVNVGHTGGNMLAEAMIAARAVGGIRNFSSQYFGGAHGSKSNHVNAGSSGARTGNSGTSFMSGGLAGVISRKVADSAVKTATAPTDPKPSSGGLGGLVAAASGGIGGQIYKSSVNSGGEFANNVIGSVATGNFSANGSINGENAAQALSSYMGYAALGPDAEHIPTFSDVEIGGGRITGTEHSEEHPEGISFGMYHGAQYTAPEGAYSTIQAADGSSWYKQYATDAVEKSPYMAPDGSIAYNESIVKKLPQPPRRKDRI